MFDKIGSALVEYWLKKCTITFFPVVRISDNTSLKNITTLLEGYGPDPLITHRANALEIFFVPILNSLGYILRFFLDIGNTSGGIVYQKCLII